jgi:TatD DNase family protein
MLIDTHCHLDAAEFDADRDVVIQQAQAAGVGQVVIPAVERANFAVVADTCRRYSGCFPAYGIHPLYVGRAAETDLEVLRNMLSEQAAVAVGEIGLDFYVQAHDVALQEHYFVEQLKIARDYDLPVILHVRRAVDAILKHLRRIKVRGGIAHAFNGSHSQAETFMALGFKLGFGGAMTYDRALRIRDLARVLPLEAIVLETDAPDMAPAWLGQGGRNSPAELPRIAQVLAELRGEGLDHIAAATARNALTVFPSIANGR